MHLPLVVEARQLAAELNSENLLILDLSAPERYHQGHIPGAISVPAAALLRGEGPVPNKIPSAAQLSALFSAIGLTPDSHVVVYDDQMGPLAGRMIWTLNCAGFNRCSMLDGQLPAWIAADLPLETDINTAQPSQLDIHLDDTLLADIPYILEHLNSEDHIILDVRSPAEFSGEKVINARKGGHIPGAVNYEWTRAMVSAEDWRLRPAGEILAELEALGVTRDKTVITHCQTHRRSGLSYLFTRQLGFDKVRCYDGSWFEWGNNDETPVESNGN